MKLFVFLTFLLAVMAVVLAQWGLPCCCESCEVQKCEDCEGEGCEDCENKTCEVCEDPCQSETCEDLSLEELKQPRWFVPTIFGYDL